LPEVLKKTWRKWTVIRLYLNITMSPRFWLVQTG
jgi:hypothetical protein